MFDSQRHTLPLLSLSQSITSSHSKPSFQCNGIYYHSYRSSMTQMTLLITILTSLYGRLLNITLKWHSFGWLQVTRGRINVLISIMYGDRLLNIALYIFIQIVIMHSVQFLLVFYMTVYGCKSLPLWSVCYHIYRGYDTQCSSNDQIKHKKDSYENLYNYSWL